MKTRRFLSFFLLLILLMGLWAPSASADSTPTLPEDPDILAKAALLVDAKTGEIAYEKNIHDKLYPASLTKIMTALLVLDTIDAGKLTMDTEITASSSAYAGLAPDGSTANIKPGETMSVQNLLYCMLVVSANEAANILGEAVSGSLDAFVDAMNKKALALGCENTHFVNPNGLHDPEHYTTAWDVYLVTQAALQYEDFATITNTANIVIPATNMSGERNYWTTNHLLATWRVIGYRNKEAIGIKTGSTSDAGYCLVSSAIRNDLHFISVILGAERVEENGVGNIRSFSETTRMFNYGFENFTYKTIIKTDEIIQEVPVALSEIDHVTVHPSHEIEVLIAKGLNPEHLERTITVQENLEAPVSKGQKLGTMVLSYDGVEYGTVDLLASYDVEASKSMVFMRDMQLFFARRDVQIGLIALAVLIVVLIVWISLLARRRSRYGRGSGRGRNGYRGGRRR